MLVKNDFYAHIFTEELSFAVEKLRAWRKRKWGRLLLQTWWQGRLMRGKKRQTETEHEGTKEGQTEVAEWRRSMSSVYWSTKYKGRDIYCLLPSSNFSLLEDFSPHSGCHDRKLNLQMCPLPFVLFLPILPSSLSHLHKEEAQPTLSN